MTSRELLVTRDGARFRLAAPQPGYFAQTAPRGAVLAAGDVLGVLDVLGEQLALVVPAGATGEVVGAAAGVVAVQYDQEVAQLGPRESVGGVAAGALAEDHHTASGPVFRAPTSGRYYGRPSPDKPAFVTPGQSIAPGATVCLLEVMKTFNRIAYSGTPAKVREILVAEGADVNAGDPILALET